MGILARVSNSANVASVQCPHDTDPRNIVGPSCSATSNSAALRAGHSSASCSAWAVCDESAAASRSVTNGFRRGNTIGSTKPLIHDIARPKSKAPIAPRPRPAGASARTVYGLHIGIAGAACQTGTMSEIPRNRHVMDMPKSTRFDPNSDMAAYPIANQRALMIIPKAVATY